MRKINVFDSSNQALNRDYIYLGLDTEMLIKKDGKILWPDEQGLPQERVPKGPHTSDGTYLFDFHGDGFATELCIAPATCLENMLKSVANAWAWYVNNNPSKTAEPTVMTFTAPSVYIVPKRVLDTASDDVKKLGCMPSLNVYGDKAIPGNLAPFKRTTGCHLHLSHPALTRSDASTIAENLVKWSDILVGAVWTYVSPEDPAVEAERRKYYGRAGEYRLKIYPTYPANDVNSVYKAGVEYRVLPGKVLENPVYFTLMFNLYREALHCALGDWGTTKNTPDADLSKKAQDAVNTADKGLAYEVLSKVNFTNKTAALIKLLHDEPLPSLDMNYWRVKGMNRKGHQQLATNPAIYRVLD